MRPGDRTSSLTGKGGTAVLLRICTGPGCGRSTRRALRHGRGTTRFSHLSPSFGSQLHPAHKTACPSFLRLSRPHTYSRTSLYSARISRWCVERQSVWGDVFNYTLCWLSDSGELCVYPEEPVISAGAGSPAGPAAWTE